MRVLHVSKVAGVGGSERHLLDLLPGLRDEGVDARMLVLRAPGAEPFLEGLVDRGVPCTIVEAGRDANPRLALAIRREVDRHRADLVHTHLVHGDVYGQAAARLARVSAVSSAHSVLSSFLKQPVRSAERFALRSARRVIAISRFVARWLADERLAPEDSVTVVPYGIDVASWRVDASSRASLRASWDAGADAFVVGMASRLVEGKGHRLALSALDQTPGDVRLVIAGTGPLEGELAARVHDDRVRLLGFVQDVPAFVGACDAIVVPTDPALGEGFGLAALEAMASGRPVIVSSVASLPEVVGGAGIVVPPHDPATLAAAIGRLASDPDGARARGEAGRARAAERYGLEAMVRATAEVYRGVR